MAKFFTIAGIENENLPTDPDVIRFYDKSSAEGLLRVFKAINNEYFKDVYVEEHEIIEE